MAAMATKEKATLMKEGMKFHAVPNKAKYLQMAVDSAYERMIGRLKKAGRPTAHVAKLRAAGLVACPLCGGVKVRKRLMKRLSVIN